MIKSRHIWIGAAALALAGALPALAGAQDAQDPHAGHHPPATAAPATPAPPSPTPTAPTAKPDGMTGGGSSMGGSSGMMAGMGAGAGKMPMMGMMGGMGIPMGCMAGSGMPMAGDIEGWIGSLRTELKITGSQVGAWSAFADVLRANVRRAGPVHAAMMSAPNGAAPLSLARRLELHDQALATRLANFRALKPTLVRLYAVLSSEQKATADRLLAHEMGMMPGMPMGGMTKN